MNIKKNRVVGARGITVRGANLNSDFNGNPKTLSDGTFMNSDVSTKYLDRDYFANRGDDVLVKKHLKTNDTGVLYAATFEEIISDKIDLNGNVYSQILNFVDVQNFGGTFTKPINFGVTGVVQYQNGVNKYDGAQFITQDIISPYGTGNNAKTKAKKAKAEAAKAAKENGATTEEVDSIKVVDTTSTNIGKHSFVEKALYVQGFTVNPSNLNNLVPIVKSDAFEGYTDESYNKFKKAVLVSSTIFTSRTKAGCYDEFAIFVNMKEGSLYTITDLGRFITVEDCNDKFHINFNELEFLNECQEVESIEIFHNMQTSTIEHKFKDVTVKDNLSVFAGE